MLMNRFLLLIAVLSMGLKATEQAQGGQGALESNDLKVELDGSSKNQNRQELDQRTRWVNGRYVRKGPHRYRYKVKQRLRGKRWVFVRRYLKLWNKNYYPQCSDNYKQSQIGNASQMTRLGWRLRFSHRTNNDNRYRRTCHKNRHNYFGYSSGRSMGTASVTQKGTGTAYQNYGNCWRGGGVRVLQNGRTLSYASRNNMDKLVTIRFKNNDKLTIRDEGDGSIVLINSLTFQCR